MFDVLVYLYENYRAFEACRDATALGRTLADAGFDDDEIREALSWLQGLARIVQNADSQALDRSRSPRIYSPAETERLGAAAVGFLMYLDSGATFPEPTRDRHRAGAGDQRSCTFCRHDEDHRSHGALESLGRR